MRQEDTAKGCKRVKVKNFSWTQVLGDGNVGNGGNGDNEEKKMDITDESSHHVISRLCWPELQSFAFLSK